jgi:formylmethanofuran dehydrogenase subunit D
MSMRVKLLTGRSIDQGRGKSLGKFSREYREGVAKCEMDPEDMELLRISEGEGVRVKVEDRSLVLKAAKSRQAPHKGMIFIPYGPWVNFLLEDVGTQGTGMPTMKALDAEVESAPEEETLSLEEILKLLMEAG